MEKYNFVLIGCFVFFWYYASNNKKLSQNVFLRLTCKSVSYYATPLLPSLPQVIAIVMDLLTDLQILQDLLDASSRRGVAVYAVLEARGVPHFLDMCARLQINAMHLRVRINLSKVPRKAETSLHIGQGAV